MLTLLQVLQPHDSRPRPTATLLGSGVMTAEEGQASYIEVEAVDPEGYHRGLRRASSDRPEAGRRLASRPTP